jgi:putative heme-binding domain-containing protein
MDGLAFASWTDYLVESIADPGAYVVEGYKNEMPYVYKPPISLTPDEIKAVIAYLQIQGGDFDIDGIKLPDRLLKASTSPEAPFVSYIPILKRSLLYYEDEELEPQSRFDSIVSGLQGDPEMGAEIFFEGTENSIACGKCHIAKDLEGEIRGATVGPELTTVAGTQPPQYIVESILSPSAKIASGYEQELIQTTGGVRHIGIIKMEDDTQVVLQMQEGEDVKEVPIPKGEIARRATSKLSLMPEGFAESFTVQQFHDLLAYVLTLRGEEETSVAETSDQNTRNIDEGE